MKTKLVFTLLILLPFYSFAQIDLANQNSISISGGTMINNSTYSTVGIGSVDTEVNVLGFLSYEHHFTNEWSLGLSSGLFNVSSNVDFNGVSSIVIFPTFFNVIYYPESFSFGTSSRGYAGIGIGAYTATGNRVGTKWSALVSNVNESVVGFNPNIGIDLYLTDWFKIGPNISYHIMSDFNEVIGERKNYSGPAFALRFGVMF